MAQRRMRALPWLTRVMLAAAPLLACSPDSESPSMPESTSEGPGPATTSDAPPPESSTGSPDDTTAGEPASTTADDDDDTSGSGIKLDVGGGQDDSDVRLSGRVLAPNGEIPIAGARVSLSTQPPSGIPDGVYCDECQAPQPGEFVTTSGPDGTFELLANTSAFDGSDAYLAVKKGQFLRVQPFTVQEGPHALAEGLTTLPGVHDPASGRWIPRIAVYETFPDEVFNVLAKFGLGTVSGSGTLVPGTEQFTLLSDLNGNFMDDLSMMSQYHILFLPCASTKTWPQAPLITPARIQNVRDYVAAGGRLYATDHSNEYIKDPFPAYLDFHSAAMPDIQPAYTVMGTVDDPGLLAWLDALPPALADIGGGNPTLGMLPSVELRDNFTGIEAVHAVFVPGEDGMPVDVGPHTWVSGPCTSCANPVVERPMAITGQYGCGRMMYSTFENSSTAHQGLNPQELVLLYMILEIGVCQQEILPPPQG